MPLCAPYRFNLAFLSLIIVVRFDALDLGNFVFEAMSCAQICLVSI